MSNENGDVKAVQIHTNIGSVFGNIEKMEVNQAPQAAENENNSTVSNEVPTPISAQSGGKVKQFTNRQLIIFVATLFNIPLNSEYTNMKAVAVLGSMLSGRSPESIRQKAMEGIDFDEESVKKDTEYVASFIEPISKEYARRLRNNIDF